MEALFGVCIRCTGESDMCLDITPFFTVFTVFTKPRKIGKLYWVNDTSVWVPSSPATSLSTVGIFSAVHRRLFSYVLLVNPIMEQLCCRRSVGGQRGIDAHKYLRWFICTSNLWGFISSTHLRYRCSSHLLLHLLALGKKKTKQKTAQYLLLLFFLL